MAKKGPGAVFINKFRLVICLLLVVCLFSGCEQTDSEEELISRQVEEFNKSIKKTGGNNAGNGDIVIGSVNMGMNGEWFAEVMNGIRNAGSDLGVRLEMLDSESDLAKEEANINALLEKGISALIISPIDYNVSAEALRAVQEAGIPIVTWNTNVNMDVNAMVVVDSTALGGDTGDYLVEYIKTNDLEDVNLYLLVNTYYDVGAERCTGFKNAVSDLVGKSVRIVAEEDKESLEDAAEATAKALKEHPEINMIWAWNQSSLLGAIQAVKAAERGDIVIMGTDMSMALADDMLGSEIHLEAITTQLPYNMGYMAVVNAVKAAKNEEVEKKVIIPLSTLVKSEPDRIRQYIENHKNLV